MCLPAERCCTLCDRPWDEVRGRRCIRAVVDDPQNETFILARKPDFSASSVRMPSNVAQSLHDHLEYLCDEPVVDAQIGCRFNLHVNRGCLGKGRVEAP